MIIIYYLKCPTKDETFSNVEDNCQEKPWDLIPILLRSKKKKNKKLSHEIILGGWEGGSRGRGHGDICMHMADSLCCTTETNTAL